MVPYSDKELKNKSDSDIIIIAKLLKVTVKSTSKIDTLIKNILKKQNEVSQITTLIFDNSSKSQIKREPRQTTKKDFNIFIDHFFVQINKSNLLGYFACGLIHPLNYETRELARSQRTKDIQHLAPNHLVVTGGFADTPSEEQVLLEVVLTDVDKQNLTQLNEEVYLLPYPLPISRVKKIYFASKESQENSKATADTFQDAYLPEHIFDIWNSQIQNKSVHVQQLNRGNIPQNRDLKIENQNHFDRVLGMFAFMKNADLYFSKETCEFSNYSEKYFKVLSLINPSFSVPEVGQIDYANREYYQSLIKPEKYVAQTNLQKIVKNIYSNETFKKEIFKEILGIPEPSVQEAFKLLVGDETKKALQEITKIKKPELVLLAFLFRFRDKEGSDKFALKEQITYLINLDESGDTMALNRANIVLATLGLYYGYRSLPKNEKIIFADKFYTSLGTDLNIKYKLNTLLDRVTIESVYQFCFHGKLGGSFEYLPNENLKPVFVNVPINYDDKSFELFQTPIYHFSPQLSDESKTMTTLVKTFWDFVKKNSLQQGDEKKLKRLLLTQGSQIINLPKNIKIEQINEPTNDKR